MPSSVKDRFTVDFEYLFFFSKNKKYYFEQQLEKSAGDWTKKGGAILNDTGWHKGAYKSKPTIKDLDKLDGLKRNKRTVWTISTKPYKGAHFAVFPEKLIETPIKAGCPANGIVLDPFMGSGTTASVAKRLNRNYVGIELNPEYHRLIHERLDKTARIKPLNVT
jgi:site-specific DNA-methyltransferase (adenine-specific)